MTTDTLPSAGSSGCPTSSRWATSALRLATGNVCTLRPHEEAAAGVQVSCQLMLGKVQILEQSFFAEDLDIVFIQEGRAVPAPPRCAAACTTPCMLELPTRPEASDARFGFAKLPSFASTPGLS